MAETDSKTKTTKRRVLTSALAIALAVLLVIGGTTLAYLQDETPQLTNTFSNSAKVEIDLSEDKTEFEIIPGTSETKNPTATVTATVDAYVYVEVTDNTQGLVNYEIADGWILLSETTSKGVTTYVYYREVTGSDNEQELQILKGDTVSYDASLTNEDLAAASDVTLAFTARAIQKDSFSSAATAYATDTGAKAVVEHTNGTATTYTSFSTAIKKATDGETVTNTSGSTQTTTSSLSVTSDITIDLGGNILNSATKNTIAVSGDAVVTITNGTLKSGSNIALTVTDGTVTLEDVEVTSTKNTPIQISDNSTLTIDADSTVTAPSTAETAITLWATDAADKTTLNVYGTVTSSASGGQAISGTGSTSYAGTTEINIYDGAEVSAENEIAVYHPKNGVMNVYGGTITGYAGIGISNGTLNITGGTVLGTGNEIGVPDEFDPSSYGVSDGIYYDGSAIILANGYGDSNVNISGGTISSTYSYAVSGYKRANYTQTAAVTVTGGTFSSLDSLTADIYLPAAYASYFTVSGADVAYGA